MVKVILTEENYITIVRCMTERLTEFVNACGDYRKTDISSDILSAVVGLNYVEHWDEEE